MISILFAMQLNAGELTAKSVIGTWYEKNNSGSEVTTFLSDGTWTAKVTYLDLFSNTKKTATINGTWKIVNDNLVKTITWAKEKKLKGKAITYKITSVTENKISFKEDGKQGKMQRLKDK